MQTEGEKKIRRCVIRDIAFVVRGSNGTFTAVSVPRQCLLVCR
jgi:hypothetical protein